MSFKSRYATAAFVLAAGGVVFGCNLVVGSGDYHVGDASFSTMVDGSVDAGGNPDGSGLITDDGGVTPIDGGGVADAVADTGTDGSAQPMTCGQGLPTIAGNPDFAKLVNACVQAVNCDPGVFAANMSDCVSNNYLQAIGSVACLATSVDCNGYYGCQGERIATVAECPVAYTGSCSGNVVTNCTGGTASSSVRNCNKTGGTCQTYVDSNSHTQAACAVVTGCTDDGKNHCSGNLLYTSCVGGYGFGRDCAAINATCKDLGDGPSCYFNAPACATAGTDTCSGSDRSVCSDVGEYDYQCGRAGLSCASDPAGGTECLAPGCEAQAAKCTESCAADGITANICVGQAPLAIDCTKYGFNLCDDSYLSTANYVFCEL